MPSASDRFSSVLEELSTIAKINAAGVEACQAHYRRYQDKESAEMLADSLALAMRQLVFLNKEMLVLAIGTEMDNAQTELTNLVRPVEQLDLFG